MEEKILAMWLAQALNLASEHAKPLIEKHGSFGDIYRLSEDEYEGCGIKKGSKEMLRLLDKDTRLCEKNLEFCNHNYFGVIEYTSPEYPKRLKNIKNPPMVLYARGRMIDFDDNVCIGVVGTRSYTDTGWNSVYKIAGGMAMSGAVVVTGLASGIDTAATRAALDFGSYSVGILGTGIERIYPSENTELFEEMYKRGLVLTELPPFSNIKGDYFPVRNRIISGLCQGVLVGEGNIKSGAMITAAHASEQGRRIFAIPGDISSEESSGVNKLIKEGATPVFSAWDVLEKYAYLYPHRIKEVPQEEVSFVPGERSRKRVRFLGSKSRKDNTNTAKTAPPKVNPQDIPIADKAKEEQTAARNEAAKALSGNEKTVYEALSFDAEMIPDMLTASTELAPHEILAALTLLEIQGFCEKKGGGYLKK